MGPEPDQIPLQGQRTLAAIVFSDVVNFGGIMSADEEHAMRIVQRDVDLMTRFCEQYEGRVLKFTGDGLLMYFHSAVQAVACALEIQKAIATAAMALPPNDILQHRIGIHLGDVFATETDVMGDGVNIAARLQSEAEPGGICLSQTVYDVVKKRLALQAAYLGPRELKHIQEAIPIYQIVLAAHSKTTTLANDSESHLTGADTIKANAFPNRVISNPAPTESLSLTEGTKTSLEKLLAESIGPISTVILQQTLKQSSSYEDLVDRLAVHLPEPEQFLFQERAERLLKREGDRVRELKARQTSIAQSQPVSDEPLHSVSESTATPVLDPDFVQRCERELTKAIGPIAHLIVQRTLSQQPDLSRVQFVEALARHLTNPDMIKPFHQRLLTTS